MRSALLIFALAVALGARAHSQVAVNADQGGGRRIIEDHPGCLPRVYYSRDAVDLLDGDDLAGTPDEMTLHPLHVSGEWRDRVDLTFFSDGYTSEEQDKFFKDARKLTADIVSDGGAMAHVAHLLNVYGVFVPSQMSGIGSHDTPLNSSAFGLYRPGPELRAVYVNHPKRARAACGYWRKKGREGQGGGCDQPILLGNDPLYGGLGGEFTIITASKLNGPLVLRHELGHSLIGVGEEYEGGYVYSGVNSDKVKHLVNLKWYRYKLTRMYSSLIKAVDLLIRRWHDLSNGRYSIAFNSSSTVNDMYPTALLRMSLSSIPHSNHVNVTLNGQNLDLSRSFPGGAWDGSKDRRWVEVKLPNGLQEGGGEISVALTAEGEAEPAGQGGKMITSVEIIEYGPSSRCNLTEGFIGAFPTYAMDGGVTLRPTNEACLLRKVNHPSFCPVCARGLEAALHRRIRKKQTRLG